MLFKLWKKNRNYKKIHLYYASYLVLTTYFLVNTQNQRELSNYFPHTKVSFPPTANLSFEIFSLDFRWMYPFSNTNLSNDFFFRLINWNIMYNLVRSQRQGAVEKTICISTDFRLLNRFPVPLSRRNTDVLKK